MNLGIWHRSSRRKVKFIKADDGGLCYVERLVVRMSRNRHEQLAVLQILVAQAMVLGSKNQGNFSGSSRRDDIPSGITRRSTVFTIETGSAGCSDDQGTVSNCLPDSVIAFCACEYILAVNGHGSCPETLGSCLADYGQLGLPHILHRPRDGADVSRAAGPYEDDPDVG